MRSLVVLGFVLLVTGCNCGDDVGRDAGVDGGNCSADGSVTLAVTTPTSFACHAQYTAGFAVVNGTCSPVTVSGIHLVETRTDGGCSPGPFPFDYQPTVTSVAALSRATVLDLTGNPFCCTAPGCPADYTCQYRFDFSVTTSAGVLTASSTGDLALAGCTELCP